MQEDLRGIVGKKEKKRKEEREREREREREKGTKPKCVIL